jgi:hypothetical protein
MEYMIRVLICNQYDIIQFKINRLRISDIGKPFNREGLRGFAQGETEDFYFRQRLKLTLAGFSNFSNTRVLAGP